MNTYPLKLPNGTTISYRVRPSKRAKYLRMTLTADKGLIVTQPPGVCIHTLQDWVNTQKDWISKNLEQVELQRQQAKPKILELPDCLELPAINERIPVQYRFTTDTRIAIDFTKESTLILSGATDNQGFCAYVLQQWLQNYAKVYLGFELQKAAEETGFSYNNYRVKGQKTRWGSCSSHGNINLNYKLLLLPHEWMRYTLIHELCHTVELNHSKRFWSLVEKHVPDYKSIHHDMKGAMADLPVWVNHRL